MPMVDVREVRVTMSKGLVSVLVGVRLIRVGPRRVLVLVVLIVNMGMGMRQPLMAMLQPPVFHPLSTLRQRKSGNF